MRTSCSAPRRARSSRPRPCRPVRRRADRQLPPARPGRTAHDCSRHRTGRRTHGSRNPRARRNARRAVPRSDRLADDGLRAAPRSPGKARRKASRSPVDSPNSGNKHPASRSKKATTFGRGSIRERPDMPGVKLQPCAARIASSVSQSDSGRSCSLRLSPSPPRSTTMKSLTSSSAISGWCQTPFA